MHQLRFCTQASKSKKRAKVAQFVQTLAPEQGVLAKLRFANKRAKVAKRGQRLQARVCTNEFVCAQTHVCKNEVFARTKFVQSGTSKQAVAKTEFVQASSAKNFVRAGALF